MSQLDPMREIQKEPAIGSITWLPMQVTVREGAIAREDGRFESDDLLFRFLRGIPGGPRAGAYWTGKPISPSALASFGDCERKWGLRAIDKLPQKDKESTRMGTAWHKELEEWLIAKTPPKTKRLNVSRDSAGTPFLSHFPRPQSKGLKVEEIFAIAAYLHCVEMEDESEERTPFTGVVVFYGYKDVENDECTWDLKTTGDLAWAKSTEDLIGDIQANVYAMDACLKRGQPVASMKWVYIARSGAQACIARPFAITREKAETFLNGLLTRALTMAHHRRVLLTGAKLDPNPLACQMYGGCDYLEHCGDLATGSRLKAFFKQNRVKAQKKKGLRIINNAPVAVLSQKEEMMGSIVDSLRGGTKATEKAAAPEGKPKNGTVTKGATNPMLDQLRAKAANANRVPVEAKDPDEVIVEGTGGSKFRVGKNEEGKTVARQVDEAKKPNVLDRLKAKKNTDEESAEPARGVNPPDAKPPTGSRAAPKGGEDAAVEEEEQEEQQEEEQEEQKEAPRRGPGRPAGVKNKAKEEETKLDDKAADKAPTKAPTKAPAKVEKQAKDASRGFTLMVDALFESGGEVLQAEELIAPARATLEADNDGLDYRFIDYGKGGAMLAAQLLADLKENPPQGTYFVSSRTVDREVLEVLKRTAKTIVRGVI